MGATRGIRAGAAACIAALSLAVGVAGAGAEGDVIRVEAESGRLMGGASLTRDGTAVSAITQEGDGVEVTITAPQAGFYDVSVRQRSVGGGEKINLVCVDGQCVGEVTSPGEDWSDGVAPYIWLEQGENAVSVMKSWGWIEVDAITASKSAPLPEDIYDVEPTLCNPNATEEARRLMTFLCDSYGEKIITGQQCDEGPFGLAVAAVWRGIGGSDYPAVLGMDLMNCTPGRTDKGVTCQTADYAIEYWETGGITTLCWHWCPDKRYDNGKDQWGTFYTENTDFDLARAMSGEDPQGYDMLLRDIDCAAAELKKMQDAGVPILWRPLHEASGGWFWWGASGPEPYIELYKLMYERMTNVHGLNNLIWVWNGQDAAWYPGDAYVDIIGEDIYPGERVYASQAGRFAKALGYTSARKIITLSENGCVPDPDICRRDGVMWSWFCTWSGEFVLKAEGSNRYSERYTEASVLKKMYADENVITRKTLPDLKTYPLRDE